MKDEADDKTITIDPDAIIAKHAIWAGSEASQKESAFSRNEAINAFCDETGIDKKALSFFRQTLKIKASDKRRSVVRSMELLMPVLNAEVFGNEPELPMDGDD